MTITLEAIQAKHEEIDARQTELGELIEKFRQQSQITEYRMFRNYDYWTRDVQGGWCLTKKDAKASYKAELRARKEKKNA